MTEYTGEFLAQLDADLTTDEGKLKFPYMDTKGILTIGIGRNLKNGLSDDEVTYLYRNDRRRTINDFEKLKTIYKLPADLSDVRKRVLLNMLFNLGLTRLLGFRLMLRAICQLDFERAADEMLSSKWAKDVGNRAKRLSEMMRTDRDVENA